MVRLPSPCHMAVARCVLMRVSQYAPLLAEVKYAEKYNQGNIQEGTSGQQSESLSSEEYSVILEPLEVHHKI